MNIFTRENVSRKYVPQKSVHRSNFVSMPEKNLEDRENMGTSA